MFVFCIYRDFLVDGLTIMKNRGYDSAGLATMAAGGGPMVRFLLIADCCQCAALDCSVLFYLFTFVSHHILHTHIRYTHIVI
jgi:hypothetical protein